jgi:hypothetical protein
MEMRFLGASRWKPTKRRFVILTMIIVWATTVPLASAASGTTPVEPDGTTPTTTMPPVEPDGATPTTTMPAADARSAEGSSGDRPELQALSEATGRSVDEVASLVDYQGRVHALLDHRRNEAWFVDFAFVRDELAGTLLAEPGVEVPEAIAADLAELRIETIDARLKASERADLRAAAEAITTDVLSGNAALVDYVAMDDTLRVWLPYTTGKDGSQIETLERRIAGIDPNLLGVDVAEAVGVGARGGQWAAHTTTAEYCTTSFGIWTGQPSYLMAGHCGNPTPSFVINGNFSSGWANRRFDSYWDRQAIFAGGAQYWTRISPTLVVDMDSTVGHIYLNDTVCRYGKTSNNLMCGTITSVNQGVDMWNGNIVLATMTGWATCFGGDSGGPAWLPTVGRSPVGLVSGSAYSGAYCMYVALDDQLAGTGWSLL